MVNEYFPTDIIDVHYQQELTVKTVVKNLPPATKNLFDKWISTSSCEDWSYKWEYLKTLKIDDYLRMYAKLPSLLISGDLSFDCDRFKLFESFEARYYASAIWVKQLTDDNLPNLDRVYNSQELPLYKHYADFAISELNLCRAIVRHPKYAYSDLFGSPIYMWFWVQIANCFKYFQESGLITALSIDKIQTKKEVNKKWSNLINYYKDTSENFNLKKPISFREFLVNFPAILPTMAQKLLSEKIGFKYSSFETQLEDALNQYIFTISKFRTYTDRSKEVQIMTLYNPSKSTPESKLFVTGAKSKKPSVKKCNRITS